MKILKHIIVLIFVFVFADCFSQSVEQLQTLQKMKIEQESRFLQKKSEAIKKAKILGIPIRQSFPNGKVIELMYFEGEQPFYYTTSNIDAAKTVSTFKIQPNGGTPYSLTGAGETLAIWDEEKVLTNHQEFGSRVTIGDNTATYTFGNHATHVAGTMVASGFQTIARGMAYQANLVSWEWNGDVAEMISAAADGLLVSNHSYNWIRGWDFYGGDWHWFGDASISSSEDYLFGFYDNNARDIDLIANNAPYYLMVRSAGNDRGKGRSGVTQEIDGGFDGYDCIAQTEVAKNILTVGSILDMPDGYFRSADVELSDFSGCGPSDDGRIKPDIVGNGDNVYSPVAFDTNNNSSNSSYYSYSGTSMASPSIAGSVGLLCEYQRELYGTVEYRSSTMKALLIHTADEAGSNPGPDYQFGWGVANFLKAAQLMEADGNDCINIREYTLDQGKVITIPIVKSTSLDLKVTICWNDPAGTPPAPSLNPTTKMLVNDLDLRVIAGGTTYSPWVLDRNNPSYAATRGDNITDNVEQIVVSSSYTGLYEVKISHKGVLQNNSQIVSVIISGNDIIDDSKTVNGYSISSNMAFWANNTINSSSTTLNSGSNVSFRCGTSILLQTGFKANSGSTFSAKIEDKLVCSPGSFLLKSGKMVPNKFILERNVITQADETHLPKTNLTVSNDILISPNPSTGIFNIKSEEVILNVDVTDLYGKVVYSQNNVNKNSTQIDLSAYNKGFYLIRLKTENEITTKKVILN